MAAVAGIRDAEFLGEQRIRDREPVVASRIAGHVGRVRHVALDAAVAGAVKLVVAVRRGIGDLNRPALAGRRVARQAERVVLDRQLELSRVRVVAIEAGDSRFAHLAREERPEFEILVPDLAVRVIEVAQVWQCDPEVVVEIFARMELARQLLAPRVAGRTALHRLLGREPHRHLRFRRVAVERPVALLAGNAHRLPCRGVGIGRGGVVLFEPGRVAIRAARIPVHPPVFPEPPLVRPARFAFVNIEPVARFWVIRRVDHLESSAGKWSQVLDQRLDTDHGYGAVKRRVSFWAGLPHGEAVPLFRDLGGEQALMKSAGGVECRAVLQRVHQTVRVGVLRCCPLVELRQMTGLALEGTGGREAGARRQLVRQNTRHRNRPLPFRRAQHPPRQPANNQRNARGNQEQKTQSGWHRRTLSEFSTKQNRKLKLRGLATTALTKHVPCSATRNPVFAPMPCGSLQRGVTSSSLWAESR